MGDHPGTSHGDSRLSVFGSGVPVNCGLPINGGPQHFVAKAALHSLDAWLRTGVAPSTAQRLDMTPSNPPSLLRNVDGIVLGGVRIHSWTYLSMYSPGFRARLLLKLPALRSGSTAPLSEERLAELYASPEDYMQRYAASTDAVIQAGFMLEADREAIIADSDPSRIPS